MPLRVPVQVKSITVSEQDLRNFCYRELGSYFMELIPDNVTKDCYYILLNGGRSILDAMADKLTGKWTIVRCQQLHSRGTRFTVEVRLSAKIPLRPGSR